MKPTTRTEKYVPRLLVIGGIPRAGTAFLRSALAAHPDIALVYSEFQALRLLKLSVWLHCFAVTRVLVRRRSRRRIAENRAMLWRYVRYLWSNFAFDDPVTLPMVKDAMANALQKPHARYVGDKYPSYLLAYPQFIHAPNTKCVFIYRDPRDVVASMMVRFRNPDDWGRRAGLRQYNTVEKATQHWIMCMACIHDLQKLDANALILRYETVLTDPASTATALANYLELPADGFGFHLADPQRIGQHRHVLTEAEIEQVETLAADWMQRYSYT